MPMISVHKLREPDDRSLRLLEEIQTLRDRTSRRAYEFYQSRADSDGSSVDDWLRAERELSWVPQEELWETDRAVYASIGLSGVADELIEVTLLPEMVILRGAGDAQGGEDSNEPRSNVLFRRIVFPSQIHAESAVIRLEDDLLCVSAAKVEPA